MDSSQASAECVRDRREYLSCVNKWGCTESSIVKRAINRGCW